MPREFPSASYDNWKTTDPRDYEPEDDPTEPPEFEEPELPECDLCGKPIEEITDEHEHPTKWGGIYVAHHRCFEEYQAEGGRGREYEEDI